MSAEVRELAGDALVRAAAIGLRRQGPDGAMPAGHNGSRQQAETPVRNTAHWSIGFLAAHAVSGRDAFREAAERCWAFLLQPAWRPTGGTFLHRPDGGKNRCNGLIGQAWVLEALLYGASRDAAARARLLTAASDLFAQLPFDDAARLWRIREVDGRVLGGPARTFNQQLWLASMAHWLGREAGHAVADRRARAVLASLPDRLGAHADGLIDHLIVPTRDTYGAAWRGFRIGYALQRAYWRWRPFRGEPTGRGPLADHYRLCLGYQAFNLTAMADLHHREPGVLGAATTALVPRALAFCRAHPYYRRFPARGYGYNYNPIGWELAWAETVFGANAPSALDWLQRQRDHYLDADGDVRNTDDPATLIARTYELYRLIAPPGGVDATRRAAAGDAGGR